MSGGKPARSAPAPTPAPAVAPAPRQARLITASAPATALAVPVAPAASAADPNQSRANPMIVDNTDPAAGGPTKTADGPGGAAGPATPQLSPDESFSLRIGGGDGVRTRAQPLGDPSSTVVQGAMIPAVLETALNSDLPGYARAIVSRDVRSFDGTRVAIPRGSRLIGQYKSGLATGQSRAFIVWSRLIRPDGVSVQLASPAADDSGQSGLAGKVDRHFVQRFGSAILLSVVSGLAGSLGDGSSSTVVIGGSADAQNAAGQALQADSRIPPTIRVPQGTPIQVFTARDLDFSGY
jgi:type IV secretion system protein VirB10